MFFRDRPGQAHPQHTAEHLHWEQQDAASQALRIGAAAWRLDLSPALKDRHGGRLAIGFEGTVRIASTPNVDVVGAIEPHDGAGTPKMLADRWKRVPARVEGHAALDLNDEDRPQMRLALFCKAPFFDWVCRAFDAGFSSPSGSVALDVVLAYPDDMGAAFWAAQWQTRTLQVLQWQLRAGAQKPASGAA